MRFEMRAPFANWSEALNETDSDEWAWMELQVKTGIELIPENPDFKTLVVPFGDVDFELEGLAVGLIRNHMLM